MPTPLAGGQEKSFAEQIFWASGQGGGHLIFDVSFDFQCATPRGLIRWVTVGGNYSLLAANSIFHCAIPRGLIRWGQLLTSDHFIFRELLCQHFMFLISSGGHSFTKWRYINVKILVPIKQKLGFHPWPEAKQLNIHTWLKAKQSYVVCLNLKIFIKRETHEVNEF